MYYIMVFNNKKVITFNLWGNNPNYTIGAIKNAEQAKNIYPDFECWFYIHQETVPQEIINELQKNDNVKIILKNGDLNTCKPMMWRFEAIDDPQVEIMLSRDTDSRFWFREKLAVEEWLQSGKLFHIMRDHPEHKPKISGGMFGTRKIPQIKNWKNLIDNFDQRNSYGYIQENYGYDQNFLEKFIYPEIKDNSIIHASFFKYEEHAKDFPVPFNQEYNFVGEYVYDDESKNKDNINQLIKSLSFRPTNPPGALVPGQRPDLALNNVQFAAARSARENGIAQGMTGKALEVFVAQAAMNAK